MTPKHFKKYRKRIGKRWYHMMRSRSMRKMYQLTVQAYINGLLDRDLADRLMLRYSAKDDWHRKKIEEYNKNYCRL